MARTVEIPVGAGEVIVPFNLDTTTTAANRVTAATADNPAAPVAVTISADMSAYKGDGSTANLPVTGQLISVNGDTSIAQVRVQGIAEFKFEGTAITNAHQGRQIQMSTQGATATSQGKVQLAATNTAAARARGYILDVNTSATTVYVLL